jgi:FixJ family two-component response regulator
VRLQKGLEQLSNREREVYTMMINGLRNLQIAKRLDVRADTIKKHRTVICEKFLVADTAGLIALLHNFTSLCTDMAT